MRRLALDVVATIIAVTVGFAAPAQVDLALGNYPSNSSCVILGAKIAFELRIFSSGNASGVILRDKLPIGTSFVSATRAPFSVCNDEVMWSIPTVSSAGDSVTVVARVDAVPPSSYLLNLASVFGNESDYAEGNNSFASPLIRVVTTPDAGCLSVVALQPGAFLSSGGQPMSILGNGFQSNATVTIAGSQLGGASFISSSQINGASPALPPGQYDLTLTNPGGAKATLIGGFNVSDPIPLGFVSVTPCRVFDTRDASGSPSLGGNTSRSFLVAGRCGVPTGAKAIALNVTIVPTGGGGSLALYAGDMAPPLASFLSFDPGSVRANNGFYPLATNGSGTLGIVNNSISAVDVVLDAFGYFQ